ncbi:MAG: hypothetical protein LBK42_05835 [Propionibacteriaceae bacterium]|jgi:hypothetical protein|nr:hypothetical protein [Propionibacteriaceae bacterium]
MAEPYWLVALGRRLGLAAGVAAVAAGAAVALLGWVWAGPGAGWAAGAGAGSAGLFFALGHIVQLLVARRRPSLILAASLTVYATQVGLASLMLARLVGLGLDRGWLVGGLTVAVVGWLAGLIQAFRRARRPVFDPPSGPSPGEL